ncbi:amidophosphoribosyltransferase [Candidatus Woesearchaeota archaeon]|nr:amidophosphoribosyltransferase [Candidatus Woesearchaeota archaeon]
MCGIAGLILKEGLASQHLAPILSLVQHRGQDAAGIFSINDKGEITPRKNLGLVSAIFEPESRKPVDEETRKFSVFTKIPLSSLEGRAAVGHVRYKTIGGTGEENAQPFSGNSPDRAAVSVALSHNGHLKNYNDIAKKLAGQDEPLLRQCDAEPIVRLFSRELNAQAGIEEIINAAGRTMDQLEGSYSVTAAVHNSATGRTYLVVFRDPYGIRPCMTGEKDGMFAVASESVALELNGFQNIRDVRPGEIVVVDEELNQHSKNIREGQLRICQFEYGYFADAYSIIEGKYVNDVRYRMGVELARENPELKDRVDIVMPVPNTAIPGTEGFRDALDLYSRTGVAKYRFAWRNFLAATQDEREKRTARNMMVHRGALKGKIVALIDDSIVRGTTSKQLVRDCRAAGAKEVYVLSLTPQIRFPCTYGIDTPTREELIAANKNNAEIAREIGADRVMYLSLHGWQNVLTETDGEITRELVEQGILHPSAEKTLCRGDFCYKCLTGREPSEAPEPY